METRTKKHYYYPSIEFVKLLIEGGVEGKKSKIVIKVIIVTS